MATLWFNLYRLGATVLAAVFAMVVHEAVKAQMSARMGDPTPRNDGRLTLNPAKHVEPIGLLCMVALGFGWSQPTATKSTCYKDREKGTIVVQTSPILVNFILGIIFAFALQAFRTYVAYTAAGVPMSANPMFPYVNHALAEMARLNVNLALINMVPVYPMCGWKIMLALLNPVTRAKCLGYEKIFQTFFALLLLSGMLGILLNPISRAIVGVG